MCRKPSSPSRIGASTSITASTLSASRARLVANILHRGVAQGASTITQQLAKNLFLTQERTVHRKLQEMLLALWLERKFSKTQILELYLNRVYFRFGRLWHRAGRAALFRQTRQRDEPPGSRFARRIGEVAVASCTDAQFRRRRAARANCARRHGGPPLHHARQREGRARASAARGGAGRQRLEQLCRRLGHGRDQRRARSCRRRPRGAHHHRQRPAGRRGECAHRGTGAERRQERRQPRRDCCDDAGRRGARHGRRTQLRRKPVQPRGRRQAPARLRLQALRLSHRARKRSDPRQRTRGQADQSQRLAAGKLQTRIFRPGHAHARRWRCRSTRCRCG